MEETSDAQKQPSKTDEVENQTAPNMDINSLSEASRSGNRVHEGNSVPTEENDSVPEVPNNELYDSLQRIFQRMSCLESSTQQTLSLVSQLYCMRRQLIDDNEEELQHEQTTVHGMRENLPNCSVAAFLFSDESSANREKCLICLFGMDLNRFARRLPCGHIFHDQCIMMWFRESHTCPVCRMFAFEGSPFTTYDVNQQDLGIQVVNTSEAGLTPGEMILPFQVGRRMHSDDLVEKEATSLAIKLEPGEFQEAGHIGNLDLGGLDSAAHGEHQLTQFNVPAYAEGGERTSIVTEGEECHCREIHLVDSDDLAKKHSSLCGEGNQYTDANDNLN